MAARYHCSHEDARSASSASPALELWRREAGQSASRYTFVFLISKPSFRYTNRSLTCRKGRQFDGPGPSTARIVDGRVAECLLDDATAGGLVHRRIFDPRPQATFRNIDSVSIPTKRRADGGWESLGGRLPTLEPGDAVRVTIVARTTPSTGRAQVSRCEGRPDPACDCARGAVAF